MVSRILWSKLFMEWQGYEICKNILYQDNKSTILLIENGRKSAGKRSRAINICYFFIADQQEKGLVNVKYCPTTHMWADPMTKPLQGSEFKRGVDQLMGRSKDWILKVYLFCRRCDNRGMLDESGFMRAWSSQEFIPAEIRVSNTILSQTRPHIFS